MPKDRKKPAIYLLSEVNVADAPAGADDAPRKFSGVANSGKPFNHYGEMVIVDLTDIKYKQSVPALLLHDRAQRAGFGVLSTPNNQLLIEGTLLDNEYGRMVAEESDAGFPWQMSAHITANSATELAKNETATVNGHAVTGPMTVLKKCSVSEISFTPTGVDDETSAIALSDDGASPLPTEDITMSPEEIAALQKQVADLTAENAELKAEKANLEKEKAEAEAEAKAAAVDAQLSQAGFTKAENGEGWNGIGKATVNMLLSASPEDATAMINDLRAPHGNAPAPVPEYLLGEQHKPNGNSQDRQLSNNPMLANASARAVDAPKYI